MSGPDGRPSVSVLVPCWNAAATIERAVASVLEAGNVGPAAGEFGLECIVVDDASTDATADVVERLGKQDPRVVLVRLPANVGVSGARNRGLDLVRGDWLTLLDADDRFLPGGLAALVGAAVGTDALAVVGQQVWSDGGRTWLSRVYDVPDVRLPGRKSLVDHPGLLYHASPHAKLFHRSCFEGLAFEGRVLGDQPWTIRALLRAGNRIQVIGETVYEWTRPGRGGPSTITSRTRSNARLGLDVVAMAGRALGMVRAEADRDLPDEPARQAVTAAYLGRLLHSDLRGLVLRALWRADPSTADLFNAIREFLDGVPGESLAASDALAVDILTPPLRHWYRLRRDARNAYWALFETAVRRDPDATLRPASRATRLGLSLARRDMGVGRQALVVGVLTAGWIAGGVRGGRGLGPAAARETPRGR